MSKASELLRDFDAKDIEELNAAYTKKTNVEDLNGITLNHEPFSHCMISNLIKDNKFLNSLRDELSSKVKYKRKNNDLYKFQQTADISKAKAPALMKFKDILYGKFLNLLKEITRINLIANKIDMTSSKYEYTDYLLCHDDDIHGEKEGRRIAFIYYLVPDDWSEVDGGQLDLFNVNEHFQPIDIVKSLVPKENRLLFFEVSDRSFHQVAEVLSKSKTRLSINGWFHGPVNYRPQPHIEIMQNPTSLINTDVDLFFKWVEERYFNPLNEAEIKKKFTKSSEIRLPKFFLANKYEEANAALKSESIVWKQRGPRNRRNYEVADENTLPVVVAELIKVLTSDNMGLTLSNLTGLGLHPTCINKDDDADEDDEDEEDEDDEDFDDDQEEDDEEESSFLEENNSNDMATAVDASLAQSSAASTSNGQDSSKPGTSKSLHNNNKHEISDDDSDDNEPVVKKQKQETSDENNNNKLPSTCHVEVRRWRPGCYTLVTDDDHELQLSALDAVLFFNTNAWSEECGGSVSYIARDENDELLTLNPDDANCLSLVYRDRETLKFTKYVNSILKEPFYEISLVYYE